MKSILCISVLTLVTISCKNLVTKKISSEVITTASDKEPEVAKVSSKADEVISKAIKAHGGELYDTADYSFVFRGKKYQFANNGDEYTYSIKSEHSDISVCDFITNGIFQRYVNEELVSLAEKEVDKYKEALNSVIYFATLPHKLKDAAVVKKFIETTTIKDQQYNVVEVTFREEGGGEDHDDEFYYWINTKTSKVDYLAYKYHVNNGGIRFRSAYNRRIVEGITFQDYVNWKAVLGTPLKELPRLFEQGELKEVSRVDIENVINLKRK